MKKMMENYHDLTFC